METISYIDAEPEDIKCGWCGEGWYFLDEINSDVVGPYSKRELAEDGLETRMMWIREST